MRVATGLEPCDPHKNPVLFIGQQKHLLTVQYSQVAAKLETRVTEAVSTQPLTWLRCLYSQHSQITSS